MADKSLGSVLHACAGVLVLICAGNAFAGPLGLPDSARPGALRPEQVGAPTTPPEPAGQVMEIPPVIDRPLDVQAGPRIVVSAFQLQDARDIPEAKLKVGEVESLLEEKRQQSPDGFTIGQLQEVANSVTQLYREHGLILAQAVIPVQNVQAGVVNVQVFEGLLGRVLTEGNKMYDSVVLQGPFKRLIGKPVLKDQVESALLRLTDFPGLTIFGVFQPGQQVGQSDLVLRVQEEDLLAMSMRIDNHGVPSTGRARFRPVVEWNNVTGGADKLSMTVQQTYHPKDNDFKAIDYSRYLGLGISGGFSYNRNDFNVAGRDFKDLHINGHSRNISAWFEKSWFRSRQFNFSDRLTLYSTKSVSKQISGPTNRTRLTILGLDATVDYVDTRFRGLNFANVEYSRGFNDIFGAMGSGASALDKDAGVRPSRRGGSGTYSSGQFDKLNATASRYQTISKNTSLIVRAEYQWSNDLLTPGQQYAVGGPDNVRAFGPAEILLDRALFASAELVQRMPFITDVEAFGNRTWGDLVQLSLFYDHAVGRLNDPLTTEPQGFINFKGAGIQARFTMPGFLEARLMAAWAIGASRISDLDAHAPLNGRRPQIWGDLTYSF